MVFRVEKTKDYCVMSNHHLFDKNLSNKSKGLLSVMLALPDEWDYSIKGLTQILKDGESSIRSSLTELEEQKYLKRVPIREGNTIVKWEYNIYELPQINEESLLGGFPQLENLQLENQVVENHAQINIKESSIKETNTKESNKSNINITTKSPKHNLYSDCIDIINDFTDNDSLRDCLVQYLNVLLEINRKNGKQLYKNVFKGKINALDKIVQENQYTDKETEAVIMLSVTNGWQNFYPLKQYNSRPNNNISWQINNDTGGEILDEQY